MMPSTLPAAAGLAVLLVLPLPAQEPAEAAARALAAGRAWRATELLRPIVADHSRADRSTVLLAARAAAGWGGWNTVSRLLADTTWEDRRSEGTARELLGRAALERRADRQAVAQLQGAVARSPDPRERGIRHALLARAHDRLEQLDSAAVHYLEAARLLPEATDWLALRAAGVLADSAARTRLYAGLELPAARPRVPWTEATARDRTGDRAGAASRYQALGAPVLALRSRAAAATTDAMRRDVRRDLVAQLTPRTTAVDTRTVIQLLDRDFAPLTAAEQLAVARRAAGLGDLARAHEGFQVARATAGLTDADRHAWGTVLARLGRHAEAIAQFQSVRGALAGSAAYQRARSLLARSGATAALPVLQEIPRRFPADTASSAVALFLAGDLLADAGDYAAARASYRRSARDFPISPHAARAALEAATLAHVLGDDQAALAEFRDAARRFGNREEGSAAAYWAGRLEAAAGDTAAARERWARLAARVPHSYYALVAARRLGQEPWAPGPGPGPEPAPPAILRTLARVALLDTLGFDTERRLELDHLAAVAGDSAGALLPLAEALLAAGHTGRAAAVAQRAQARGAPRDTRVYRLLYPVPDPEGFRAMVASRQLDPWLVAGLIRQESAFDPAARSVADARGLMQVVPAVGGQLARRLGWPEWDPVLLYQPEVSLALGTTHLQEMQRRFPEVVQVLAAYNAGASRVERWVSRPGARDDPELFLEQIPYLETRNYVRRVLRNAAFYQALYGDPAREPGT